MQCFELVRTEDVSGVSGTGVVAEGVVIHDGQVVMSWFGEYHTMEVSPSLRAIVNIHGHHGRTFVRWKDGK